MHDEIGDWGAGVYGLAPRAMRRGRMVQLALVGGSIGLAAVTLAYLHGSEGFGYGVALAMTTLGLGLGLAWYVGRTAARVRLIVGTKGIGYEAGTHAIVAAWEDVVAIDDVIQRADTGPALVLRGDHAVGGAWMLRMADIGEVIERMGSSAPSYKETIPLSGFIHGTLAESPLCGDLRRHIPELVDAYLARHAGAPTR